MDARTNKFDIYVPSTNSFIELNVMQSIGYSFSNSSIVYEAVGSDGGFVISTGRVTQEIPVTLQLIDNLQNNLKIIKQLKDQKLPVYVFDEINGSGLFGKYLIKAVDTNITDGTMSMIVNITFIEYRDISISKTNIVIPADKGKANTIQYLRNYNMVRIDK